MAFFKHEDKKENPKSDVIERLNAAIEHAEVDPEAGERINMLFRSYDNVSAQENVENFKSAVKSLFCNGDDQMLAEKVKVIGDRLNGKVVEISVDPKLLEEIQEKEQTSKLKLG
jgi:hypothetical protein